MFKMIGASVLSLAMAAFGSVANAGGVLVMEKMPGAKKASGIMSKDFEIKMETIGDDGTFVGYGSVFGNVDSYREVVAPGAFTQTLKDLQSSGRKLPILWNHNSNEPIGFYTSLVEDAKGLRVEGQLLIEDVARAREIFALMKAGAISGLSIGYWEVADSLDQSTGIRTLSELKLRECSLVTFPANDDARIETIKMKLAGGTLPTLREFETILRDAGYSKQIAKRISAKGYGDLSDRRDADLETKAVSQALDSVSALFDR